MWCQVILDCVNADLLPFSREVDSPHLHLGTFTLKIYLQALLAQGSGSCHIDPVQFCSPLEPSLAVAKVDHFLLEDRYIRKMQPGILLENQICFVKVE